jgi:hypothetical protein
VIALGRVHAGDRLVEQHDARLHRQAAGELDALLQAVGQRVHGGAGQVADVDELEGLARGGAVAALLAPCEPQPAAQRPCPHEVMAADHDVLEDRERREDAEVLEAARDPDPGQLAGRQPQEVPAVERHGATARLVHARQRVEQRALAGAVGTDHREQLAAGDVEADAGERGHRTEAQGEIAHRQQGLGHQAVTSWATCSCPRDVPR